MLHRDTQSNRHWEDVSITGAVKEYDAPALHFKDTQFGYWVGFGLLKPITPKISAVVEFRYSRLNGILNILPYPGPTDVTKNAMNNLQLTLGLRLR